MAVRSVLVRAVLVAAIVSSGVFSSSAQPSPASAMETPAGQAIVVDGRTGAVLFEKNADETFAPASLAKLMTMELVFHALAEGRITRETAYPVSENAWRTGGAPSRTATMFAELRSSVPVEALMRGVIVQGANDASIILGEGMEGTEGAFVQAMNERALALGLTASRFVNATGLPAEGQAVSARDLARLARHVETSYPAEYGLYSEPEFTWNDIRQRNRNPLLSLGIGATGMATGFTQGEGYSIVGVAGAEGASIIVALAGLESEQVRSRESARLLAWAAESFDRRTLFGAQAQVGRALVYGGTVPDVALVTSGDIVALVPKGSPASVRGAIVYDGPLRAPVSRGDRVGELQILLDGRPSIVQDLFAAEDVRQGTFMARALGAARELAFGWIRAL